MKIKNPSDEKCCSPLEIHKYNYLFTVADGFFPGDRLKRNLVKSLTIYGKNNKRKVF